MIFDHISNNNNTQKNDNIFDVNLLHDGLFGVSSVSAQEAPRQGYSSGNSRILGEVWKIQPLLALIIIISIYALISVAATRIRVH